MTSSHSRNAIIALGLGVLCAVAQGCAAGRSAPDTVAPSEREKILVALRSAVADQVRRPVTLEIEALRSDGRWAFATAVARGVDGEPLDYSNTRFAGDISDGTFDDWLCALLGHDGTGWAVVSLEIGATDAPFADWPERFGVPRELVMPGEGID